MKVLMWLIDVVLMAILGSFIANVIYYALDVPFWIGAILSGVISITLNTLARRIFA